MTKKTPYTKLFAFFTVIVLAFYACCEASPITTQSATLGAYIDPTHAASAKYNAFIAEINHQIMAAFLNNKTLSDKERIDLTDAINRAVAHYGINEKCREQIILMIREMLIYDREYWPFFLENQFYDEPTFKISKYPMTYFHNKDARLIMALRDEFEVIARSAGLDVDTFDQDTWNALLNALKIIVENLLQHEYAEDRNARLLYRIHAKKQVMVFDFLGRGYSERLFKKVVKGKKYSAFYRPWTAELAPAEVWNNRSRSSGIGLYNMFIKFALFAYHYWANMHPLKDQEVTISWDENKSYFTIPEATGTGHHIQVRIPLRKKPATIKDYPKNKKQFKKRIRAYLVQNHTLIWRIFAENIRDINSQYSRLLAEGNISFEYCYVLAHVLTDIFQLKFNDGLTRFSVEPVISNRTGELHTIIVFYFNRAPILIIDPAYYKFRYNGERRQYMGKIITTDYDLSLHEYRPISSKDLDDTTTMVNGKRQRTIRDRLEWAQMILEGTTDDNWATDEMADMRDRTIREILLQSKLMFSAKKEDSTINFLHSA